MGKTSKYLEYKSLRKEQNLAVKGILSVRDVFVTGSAGHVIKCVTSLNTSNSTKNQIVDISYQMFFSLPASSAHKERLARETSIIRRFLRFIRFSQRILKQSQHHLYD